MQHNDDSELKRRQVTRIQKPAVTVEPKKSATRVFTGQASYYNGPSPDTASMQPFDKTKIAGAMTNEKLPKFPVTAIVTYKRPGSGKIIRLPVLINDHGPFATDKSGLALRPLRPHPTRVIDLTPAAFTALTGAPVAQGILDDVTVEVPAVNR
jgi:rare lipoprotein A (peptidoglycan hydrolase)